MTSTSLPRAAPSGTLNFCSALISAFALCGVPAHPGEAAPIGEKAEAKVPAARQAADTATHECDPRGLDVSPRESPVNKPELEPASKDARSPQLKGGLPTYNPGRPNGALSGKTVFLSPGHGWYYSETLGRWATQRGNTWGLIEDHSNGEAVLNHLARYLHNAGANVWPCRERDFNTNMVIVDNTDGEPGFTVTGTWPTSTGAGNWWGSNYQYHAVSTTETAVATYAPDIPGAGYYAVYIWTPAASNRSTDATVRVNHTGGTTTHIINMQQDGNTWRLLGHYYFNAGRDTARGSVEISNQGSDTSKYVIADAVRFGGGMGSIEDGGSTSGKPRWEEAGNYFAFFMGHGSSLDSNHVRAMPRYAKWESESWEDSIYVSRHSNAYNGTARGTHIYVYGPDGPGVPGSWEHFSGVVGSDSLATRIIDEVINDVHAGWDADWPDGRRYAAWFGELDPVENDEMPSCLIEVAFHDNELDARALSDPRFRDLVGRALYQGIVAWWYNDADGPSTTPIPTDTLLPEPPTHLSVSNIGGETLRISWHAPPFDNGDGLLGDPATGYLVCTSSDGYGFDDGTPTTDTWMDFSGLQQGSVYYFRVIATNAGGQSFPSEIGGAMVTSSGSAPILIVNGFDRLDRGMMLVEDDPYSSNDLLRERLLRMNHYGYVRTFAAAIEPTGLPFDSCANEAVRDSDVDLDDYGIVIWQVGEESDTDHTFDALEQLRLRTYLDGRGHLFVSGSEIGWELDYLGHGVSFYNDYLKADYVADDAGTYSVSAVPGSVFDGITPFWFDDGTTIYDVTYPDVITPLGGAAAALDYSGGTGGTAGVVFDGPFKVVHFGFPFEAITSASVRADVMQAVLDYLLPMPPGDFDADGDVDMTDFGHLQECLSGPSVPQLDPDCVDARLDSDRDVDGADVSIFQGCLSGADVPADPDCAG